MIYPNIYLQGNTKIFANENLTFQNETLAWLPMTCPNIYLQGNTKIFANENLTFQNETLAFHGRKLKREGHILSSYTRNGVVFIKKI